MPVGHLDHASNTTRFPSASEKTGLDAIRWAGATLTRRAGDRNCGMTTKDKADAVSRRLCSNTLVIRDEESGSKEIGGYAGRVDRALPKTS